MAKVKYLNDGRKVVVIGEINSNESIVQEIFVTKDGDEIPSGERFTTKSLHDEPVLSYKEKRERELSSRLDSIEKRIEMAKGKEREALDSVKSAERISYFPKRVQKSDNKQAIDGIESFLNGDVKYLVFGDYSLEPPVKLEDAISIYERKYGGERCFEGLKLISLYGDAKGDLSYKISRYGDGSGNSQSVYPFKEWDSAIEKVKELAIKRINEGYFSKEDYAKAKDLGITFTKAINKTLKKKFYEGLAKLETETTRVIADRSSAYKGAKEDLDAMFDE